MNIKNLKYKRTKGFTLVESLVTVVLLATVAASLSSVFVLVSNRYKSSFVREEAQTFARRFVSELEYAARTSGDMTGSLYAYSPNLPSSLPSQYDSVLFNVKGSRSSSGSIVNPKSYRFIFRKTGVVSGRIVGTIEVVRSETNTAAGTTASVTYVYPFTLSFLPTSSVVRPFYVDPKSGAFCYSFSASTEGVEVDFKGLVPIIR